MTQNHHLLASGIAFAILTLAGCGDGTPPADAAPADAGPTMDAAPGEPCTRDSECDDGLFCTVRRCVPADPSADSRGCLTVGSPCAEGEMCSEADELCSAIDCSTPDQDGDGEDAVACGGVDCDDSDKFRFGGRTEICDAEGHDEDCVDDTLAGPDDGDLDGDGFVSDACCFGTTCGGDCDDDDGAVNPDAREVCNGLDDDCSGAVDDETSSPLCPGGTCDAGRCSFRPWDRIFGGSGNDRAQSVVTDAAGNVYVAGLLAPGSDFGAGPEARVALASYTPDGLLRWTLPFEGPGFFFQVLDLAHEPTLDRVLLVGQWDGDFSSGGVTVSSSGPQTVVLAVNSDASIAWGVSLPPFVADVEPRGSISAANGTIVVGGSFDDRFEFMASTHDPVGATDGALFWLSPTGSPLRLRTFGSAGARVFVRDVATEGDDVLLGARFTGTVDFGAGPVSSGVMGDAALALLDPAASTLWSHVVGSANEDVVSSVALGPNSVAAVGTFATPYDFGGGPLGRSPSETVGFVLGLERSDGSYRFARAFEGIPAGADGYATPHAVEVTPTGDVVVTGEFFGTVRFGIGGLTAAAEPGGGPGVDVFLARYTSTGAHARDRALGGMGYQSARALDVGPGGATTIAGTFRNSIDLGSGARTTGTSGAFGFVGRVPD
ncbi:MAG: putative metal-binding motif-containing protein [Sandaracinaceae bacterium]